MTCTSGPQAARSGHGTVPRSPAGRAGSRPEESTLRSSSRPQRPDGAFITGSDFLIDGGVTASYFFGELAPG